MKTILKITALSAVLLMLAGGLVSCNEEQNSEYRAVCARIVAGGVAFCPPRLIIESERPIANTNPRYGFVSFLVDANSLPQEFRGVSTQVIVTFRLTGEKGYCFGKSPFIEILTIEKCN